MVYKALIPDTSSTKWDDTSYKVRISSLILQCLYLVDVLSLISFFSKTPEPLTFSITVTFENHSMTTKPISVKSTINSVIKEGYENPNFEAAWLSIYQWKIKVKSRCCIPIDRSVGTFGRVCQCLELCSI